LEGQEYLFPAYRTTLSLSKLEKPNPRNYSLYTPVLAIASRSNFSNNQNLHYSGAIQYAIVKSILDHGDFIRPDDEIWAEYIKVYSSIMCFVVISVCYMSELR
jgi:hypothetical protein